MQAWPHIEGSNVDFIDGLPIQVVCEHLEAVERGDVKRIIINMPYRCGKSILTSVCFPAWVFIRRASTRFVCASYAKKLSLEHSVNCRRLIQSQWFQSRWGHLVAIQKDQNAKERFDTTAQGYRISVSVGSALIGFGGDILIVDDPHSPAGADSAVKRESTLEWYAKTFSSRLNKQETGAIIIIMQRLHEMDLTGYILSRDQLGVWTHLMLPMEYDPTRKCSTLILPSTNGKVWTDPRTQDNELLWPQRINAKALGIMKQELGSSVAIAGQLQQMPYAQEGNIIKKSWFKEWKSKIPPPIEYKLQSWDTAISDTPTSAYSACTTWGVFYDKDGVGNVMFLGMWKGRVDYPVLRERAQRLYYNYKDTGEEPLKNAKSIPIDTCIIEQKATGDPLIQDLRRAGIVAQPFNPTRLGDKTARVNGISHLVESGLVWLPAQEPNFDFLRPDASAFVEEIIRFPNVASRDLVDSMTQALFKLQQSGMLNHPKNPYWEAPDFKKRNLY